MKLKHSINYGKKHTIAIFVKVEKEEPIVCTFNKQYQELFNKLVKDKYYTISMPFSVAHSDNTRILFVTYREVKNYTHETWKIAGNSLVNAMNENRIEDIEIDMAALFAEIASEDSYTSFCNGIILSNYAFTKYLSEKQLKDIHFIKNIILVSEHKKETEHAIEEASKTAKSVFWTRDMVNEPSNVINSVTFVERAKKEAASRKITATIIDEKQLKTLAMNGILGVNAGSKNPPRIFIAQYKNPKAKKTILLVGKGVTFDTGGMCLKSAEGMVTMKDDMAGAAAVCGALFLISDRNVEANVIAITPLTDNKTGSGAINPGDILKMYNGITVEVDNTDAEGRLILADALAYGIKKYKPDYTIDIATLTGACSIALGKWASGLMSKDDTLIKAIKEAGEETYERVWTLPMFDEYKDSVKSQIADIKNTGGRLGGAMVAAQFISYFTEGAKWAHIDIASTSYFDKPKGYIPQGATGVGVMLLTKTVEKLIEN